jgi:biopolymer transport protein ExbD
MKHRPFLDSHEESDESMLNLTPLIDVVFILLITFILIAPILKFDRIELAYAKEQKKEEQLPSQNRNSITIRVFEDNTITINNREVIEKELLSTLMSLKKNHPKEIPLLFHDKKANFGTYQSIKNAVETAGFDEMDLLLKP